MKAKFKIGTKWVMTTVRGEKFQCEVIPHTDPRLEKIAFADDICLWFPDLGWANTYDEFILEDTMVQII